MLKRRHELWSPGPGLIGLRGSVLALYEALERAVAAAARADADDEWRVPAGIPLELLARADYFASFPHWLTLASHLRSDQSTLEQVAASEEPQALARNAAAPAAAALPPAACYHVYGMLAGAAIGAATRVTVQCTCWRHEGARLAPLERDWAFTMREVVCIGSGQDCDALRANGTQRILALAAELGIDVEVRQATDPFFADEGKSLLQRLKALKHEVVLPLPSGRPLAMASVNGHEGFFGRAFGIRLSDGTPAETACVAFGVERWLLAFLLTHGVDARDWPAVGGCGALAPEAVR
jgi:seryl-tRNA synthetase